MMWNGLAAGVGLAEDTPDGVGFGLGEDVLEIAGVGAAVTHVEGEDAGLGAVWLPQAARARPAAMAASEAARWRCRFGLARGRIGGPTW